MIAHTWNAMLRRLPPAWQKALARRAATGSTPGGLPGLRRRIDASIAARCRDRVYAALEHLETGCLDLRFPDGESRLFGDRGSADRHVLTCRSPHLFVRCCLHGASGLEAAYVNGEFETENLPGLLRLLILNRTTLGWAAPGHRLPATPRPAGTSGDAAGDDLARRCLDPGLHTTCGYYGSAGDPLERAQYNTVRILIEKACLRSSDHVLDAGCGWGAFAIEAARQTGCRVTAVVPSEARYDFVYRRVRELKMEERVTVLLKPFAEIAGPFDRVVCLEAPEALAAERLDGFFAACEQWLKPEGLAVLQVLTVPDHLPARVPHPWLSRLLQAGPPAPTAPSFAALCRSMTRRSSLVVEDMENIAAHHPLTLRAWTRGLPAPTPDTPPAEVRRLREWRFDLARFEAAALERETSVLQLVLTRPGNRSLPTIL